MSVMMAAKDEPVLDLYEMYDDDYEDDEEQPDSINMGDSRVGHTAENIKNYNYQYNNYDDNEGPSTSSSTLNEEVDDSDDFGIKIVSTESLMENNCETEYRYNEEDEDDCSLGDDENYRFLIPDVEIEEVPSPEDSIDEVETPQQFQQPNIVHSRRRARFQKPALTAENYFKRLLPADPVKPNILNKKMGIQRNAVQKMPPPPPLTRRPSVATVQSQSSSRQKPPPVQLSLEQILRSSKPMPRLQPKIGPTGKIAIERLPNPRMFQKSFQNRTILPANNASDSNSHHSEHPLLGERISKKTVPQCPVCNKTFATYTILYRHEKTHEQIQVCSVCQMGFSDQAKLDEHVKSSPKCNSSGLQCRVCYRSFATNAALVAHMPVHEGMFRCRGCRKGFYDYASMEEHEATHTRYACEWCGKTFMNSGNLKAHERIHTGERPFKCADCPKAFKQLGGLQYHLKTNPAHRNAQHC